MIIGLGIANMFGRVLLYFIFQYSENDNSQLQSNSREFACNLTSGYVGIIFSGLFLYVVALLLLFNYLRHSWVRHAFASLVDSYLVPSSSCSSSKDSIPRMLCPAVAIFNWINNFC